jgi:transposase, IS30 family
MTTILPPPAPTASRAEHRAYWEAKRAEFFAALNDVKSVTLAAQQVGIRRRRGQKWASKAGIRSVRPGHSGRARYAELRAQGMSLQDAAAEVGISVRGARDWDHGVRYVQHHRVYPDGRTHRGPGGAPMDGPLLPHLPDPATATRILHPRFLSAEERIRIADLLERGQGFRAIGRTLGRTPSVIGREVRRNRGEDGVYRPHHAHCLAATRRPRPKASKLAQDGPLRAYVKERLGQQWSPEQISQTLPVAYPDDEAMRVSTETIYQAIYVQARGGLKREVTIALRRGRTRRTPHRAEETRTTRFKDPMVMISERPPTVEDRAVPGHWEGDLIMGAGNRSAIVTLVERATRFVLLGHLPGGHTAEEVRDVLVPLMQTLPTHLRSSLTWDQGSEMAAHRTFSLAAEMPVYFCDPASPWQRGSNENTNGLLRQYFPKGTDLSVHTPEDLARVADLLNSRPRKTLAWKTPAQRLHEVVAAV